MAPICVCPAPPFPAAPTPALGNPDALEAASGCLPVPTPQLCLLWDPDLAAAAEPRRLFTCASSEPANQLLSPRNLGREARAGVPLSLRLGKGEDAGVCLALA